MSKDKEAKRNDSTAEDAADAAAKAKEENDQEELDEGLDESFLGSDAPSSTRRSSKD